MGIDDVRAHTLNALDERLSVLVSCLSSFLDA